MLNKLAMMAGKFCTSLRRALPRLLKLRCQHTVYHDAIRRQQRRDRIAERLAAMPIMVREVFVLRVIEGLPMDEVTHRLAISRNEARKNLARAIRGLMR